MASGSGYPKGGRVSSTDRAAERALADADARADAAQRAAAPRERMSTPNLDVATVESVIETAANLSGRPISLVREGRDPKVVQLCRACRVEVVATIPHRLALESDWMAQLAHMIRHTYDSHLCAPIETAVHQLTDAERDDLLYLTENELERVGKRLQELRDFMLARIEEAR